MKKNLGKKILVYLMTFMMVFSTMPVSAFADGNADEEERSNAAQIGDHYEVNNGYDGDGTIIGQPSSNVSSTTQDGADDNWNVRVSKEISPLEVEEENKFKITLTVETKQLAMRYYGDSAVVLVIDASSSMVNYNLGSVTRLAAAKTAAVSFVEKYAELIGGKRMISIVSFDQNSHIEQDWIDLSEENAEQTVISAINGINSDGGTNIHGGLLSAADLLKSQNVSTIETKGAVLLSDGAPSSYVSGLDKSNGSDEYNGVYRQWGCECHDKATIASEEIRDDIGAEMYSVFCGDSDDNLFCRCMKTTEYLTSISDLMREADNAESLADAFDTFFDEIKSNTQAWGTIDPMGPNTQFNGLITNVEEGVITSSASKLEWDLIEDKEYERIIEENGDIITTIYKYQVEYEVELDTLAAGYKSKNSNGEYIYYATNGPTKLDYYIEGVSTKIEKIWFNIPSVKGYAGDYAFKKVNENGEPIEGATFTLTTADNPNWSMNATSDADGMVNFNQIPSGHTYTLSETEAPKGYKETSETHIIEVAYGKVYVDGAATEYEPDNINPLTIRNEPKPTIDIEGTKTWQDNNNASGLRPDGITVNLYANNTLVEKQEVTGPEWKYKFEKVDKYDDNDNEISYRVEEESVENYSAEYVDTSVGTDIVNTLDSKVTIEGIKTWKNDKQKDRPNKITLLLYQNGEKIAEKTVDVRKANSFNYSFGEYQKYDENGQEYTYTVVEVVPDGYSSASTTLNGVIMITNTHTPETTSVTVTKAWDDAENQDGLRPDSIGVQLYANSTAVGNPIELKGDSWSYTWKDLDKKSEGRDIVYTVDEVKVPDGYTKTVSGDQTQGFTITNTHIPEVTQLTFIKKWVDNNDQDGIRPDKIQVQLYANGDKEGNPVTVTEEDEWMYTWTDLAVNSAGEEISYTVDEIEVPEGYEASIDGMTITNTHTPETINITGSKTWNDNDNQDGLRPKTITVRLYANGILVEDGIRNVGEEDDWTWNFEDLPKYENGEEIIYAISEDAVEGYEAEISEYDIVNTHAPGKTNVTVIKSWNDQNNIAKVRPDNVQVQLYADGEPVGEPATLDAKGNWS